MEKTQRRRPATGVIPDDSTTLNKRVENVRELQGNAKHLFINRRTRQRSLFVAGEFNQIRKYFIVRGTQTCSL
jgi:predicted pyridoxine 5'-phosphate oxidase superfamily flavin-nucleotide-binding protein